MVGAKILTQSRARATVCKQPELGFETTRQPSCSHKFKVEVHLFLIRSSALHSFLLLLTVLTLTMKFSSLCLLGALSFVGQSLFVSATKPTRMGDPLQSSPIDLESKDTQVETSSSVVYVVTYPSSLPLTDVVYSLKSSGVEGIHVERQLSCTRGLVVLFESEEEKVQVESNAAEGMKFHVYSSTHGADVEQGQRRTANDKCKCKDFPDNSDTISSAEAELIYTYIEDHVLSGANCFDGSTGDCAGALIRNAFHDAAPFDTNDSWFLSGSNGCVDLTDIGNNGLGPVNTFLQGVKNLVETDVATLNILKKISMADLIAMGGAAAIKATGGPEIRVELGRHDIPCSCEDTMLPPAEPQQDANFIVENLAHRLKLKEREMVALMGTHTIGQLHPANAGYTGTWVQAKDAATFDNQYFWMMHCIPWFRVDESNAAANGLTIPTFNGANLTEWIVSIAVGRITFLNTDVVLGFDDIENCKLFGGVNHLPPGVDPSICDRFDVNGTNIGPFFDFAPGQNVNNFPRCEFRGNLTHPDKSFEATVDFLQDEAMYFAETVGAYRQMMERTVPCGKLYTPA